MNIPLFLFAKAPIPGKVKTRLQSHCSAEQAAEIAKVLLEESIIKAVNHWPGKVYVSVALDEHHSFLKLMLEKYEIGLVKQVDGDLGVKMHQTFEKFGYPAAIMGCDAPHIKAKDLSNAYQYLQQGQSTLGPSNDGGYYLVGLHQPFPQVFKNQQWGTSSVLKATQNIARQHDIQLKLLSELNDVDEWEDLVSAAELVEQLQCFIS